MMIYSDSFKKLKLFMPFSSLNKYLNDKVRIPKRGNAWVTADR